MTPSELAARLESGTGPDREADARVQSLLEGSSIREEAASRGPALVATMPAGHSYFAYWPETGECWPSTPKASSDVGEALALLARSMPGAAWMVAHNVGKRPAEGYVYRDGIRYDAASADPARALAAAIVRAFARIEPRSLAPEPGQE